MDNEENTVKLDKVRKDIFVQLTVPVTDGILSVTEKSIKQYTNKKRKRIKNNSENEDLNENEYSKSGVLSSKNKEHNKNIKKLKYKKANTSTDSFKNDDKSKNHEPELIHRDLFLKNLYDVLSTDYENPSVMVKYCVDSGNFHKHKPHKIQVCEDRYITFMRSIKEREWKFVFNGLTTRFNSLDLMPSIGIRCIFYFILTTNNNELLRDAVNTISSYWQTYPSCCAKSYYKNLLLETENDIKYPASIGDKLFNKILDIFVALLLNGDKPIDIYELTNTKVLVEPPSKYDSDDEFSSDDEDDMMPLLTLDEYLDRTKIAFGLLLDLLESDFYEFLKKYNRDPKTSIFKKQRQPLIVNLDTMPDLEIVFKAFHACKNQEHAREISRYINLLAEVRRIQELEQEEHEDSASIITHPCFGEQCVKFADYFGYTIIKNDRSLKEKVQMLTMFQPWIQMYIYSRWITEQIGIVVRPTMMFVVKVIKLYLEEIPKAAGKNCDAQIRDLSANTTNAHQNNYKEVLKKYRIYNKSLKGYRNPKGETCLIDACKRKKPEIVKALLSLPNIDVNAVCNAGWSALHEATAVGRADIVRMLLSHKPSNPDLKPVNICIANPLGITPLHDAVVTGNLEICQLLIEKGGVRIMEMESKNGLKPGDCKTSDAVKEYLKQVWDRNQNIDYTYKKLILNIETINLILLRELTFAILNVYSIREIIQRGKETHHQILCNNQYPDRAKLKIDYEFFSHNINAFRELKCILKSIRQNHPTKFSDLIGDWLNCLN